VGEASAKNHETAFPSDTAEARRVQEEITLLLAARHFDEREIFGIRLSLEEALVNAVKHGNQMDRNKQVRVSYRMDETRFEVTVQDEGSGFNPEEVPDPLDFENMERPCGRGLLLMRTYMTEVIFHPPGNKVTMTKVRGQLSRNGRA
jgi:serine/threonine-protein kinase RsbW